MSVTARAASLFVAFLVVAGLVTFVALYYMGGASALPTVHYAASGAQVNVVSARGPAERFSQQARLGQLFRSGPGDPEMGSHHIVFRPGQYEGQRDPLRL